jgi:hypothetical protein
LMTEILDLIEDDIVPGRHRYADDRDLRLHFFKGCREERAVVERMRELFIWFLRSFFVHIDRSSVRVQPRTDSSGREFTYVEFKMRDFQKIHRFDMYVKDVPPYLCDPTDPREYSTFYIRHHLDDEPLGAILAMLDRRTARLERHAYFTSGTSALPASAC